MNSNVCAVTELMDGLHESTSAPFLEEVILHGSDGSLVHLDQDTFKKVTEKLKDDGHNDDMIEKACVLNARSFIRCFPRKVPHQVPSLQSSCSF